MRSGDVRLVRRLRSASLLAVAGGNEEEVFTDSTENQTYDIPAPAYPTEAPTFTAEDLAGAGTPVSDEDAAANRAALENYQDGASPEAYSGASSGSTFNGYDGEANPAATTNNQFYGYEGEGAPQQANPGAANGSWDVDPGANGGFANDGFTNTSFPGSGFQQHDDGSTFQRFEDGSTLAMDTDGRFTSRPATDSFDAPTNTGDDPFGPVPVVNPARSLGSDVPTIDPLRPGESVDDGLRRILGSDPEGLPRSNLDALQRDASRIGEAADRFRSEFPDLVRNADALRAQGLNPIDEHLAQARARIDAMPEAQRAQQHSELDLVERYARASEAAGREVVGINHNVRDANGRPVTDLDVVFRDGSAGQVKAGSGTGIADQSLRSSLITGQPAHAGVETGADPARPGIQGQQARMLNDAGIVVDAADRPQPIRPAEAPGGFVRPAVGGGLAGGVFAAGDVALDYAARQGVPGAETAQEILHSPLAANAFALAAPATTLATMGTRAGLDWAFGPSEPGSWGDYGKTITSGVIGGLAMPIDAIPLSRPLTTPLALAAVNSQYPSQRADASFPSPFTNVDGSPLSP